MKLDAVKFGLATAGTFAIIWLICSLLVWIVPSLGMHMSGHLLENNMGQMHMAMGFAGITTGIVWSVLAGLSGCLLAWLYNLQQ